MILITESKRDDLLIPYYNLVKDVYPNLALGEFKKMMLKKLAAQGGINNLSLSSNYYLAGATKYYFQGMLTVDGKKNILTGNPDEPDNWNVDVCRRLNACINVLRNAYIDTVGTTFEQPEDFGEMSLPKLLRKYNKKIEEELGNDSVETNAEVQPVDELNRDNNVGNGYTFEILYNYPQATKYNQYTNPGAWCITYGQGHYDGYIRREGIHYVIFRKNGFEQVPREHTEGFTPEKPHDEYGNSLIAYLQYNNRWDAPIITSRWNHGYGEWIEADKAYSIEEFMSITGVKKEDLERILKIWKTDYKKYNDWKDDEDVKIKIDKKLAASILRKIKYLQMLLNGGEAVERAAQIAGLALHNDHTKVLFGNGGDPRKCAMRYHFTVGDNLVEVLIDRNKVVFESVAIDGEKEIVSAKEEFGLESELENLVIIKKENKNMIYNCRYREFLSVNGINVFKKIPKPNDFRVGAGNILFFELKNSMKDGVLISAKTGRPVKLPNGEYWYNAISWTGYNRWENASMIHCHVLRESVGPALEIIYDESSNEKYFFDMYTGKFMEWVNKLVNHEECESYSRSSRTPEQYVPMLVPKGLSGGFKDLFAIAFSSNPDTRYYGYMTTPEIYNVNGQKFSIYGQTKFKELQGFAKRIIVFMPDDYEKPKYTYHSSTKFEFYDHVTKKLIAVGDKVLFGTGIHGCNRWSDVGEDDRYLYIELPERGEHSRTLYAIYDSQQGLLLKNTTKRGREMGYTYQFECWESENQEKIMLWTDGWDRWEFYNKLGSMPEEERMKKFGSTDNWHISNEVEKRHYQSYNPEDFERIPNNLPINNESEVPAEMASTAEPAQSISLSESDIHRLVTEAIRRIVNQ